MTNPPTCPPLPFPAPLQALKELDDYANLPDDLIGSSKRWREWMELERPEDEPLPGDWKRMPEFDRLLLFRALRPDRLTSAMSRFVCSSLDPKYVTSQAFDLERSYSDSSPSVPTFVFLSPGVDVAGSVEALGKKLGFTLDNGKYAAVSLGQGQEPIAMNNLNNAHKNGGWVLLQNIHLTIDWTAGPLEKKVDKLAEGAHPEFRCPGGRGEGRGGAGTQISGWGGWGRGLTPRVQGGGGGWRGAHPEFRGVVWWGGGTPG